MNKSQSAIFKRLVKICVPFILACTILFLVDPSLNLKKIVSAYSGQAPVEYLEGVVRPLSIMGYCLANAVIILLFLAVLEFGWRAARRWILGTFVVFLFLPYFTGFPTLGQLSLVWANPISWDGDIERYKLLIKCLAGWAVSFLLENLVLRVSGKRNTSGE